MSLVDEEVGDVVCADSEAFRGPPPTGYGHERPRLRRRSVSFLVDTSDPDNESSPPTRGCSGEVHGAARLDAGLPADAGVFR
ncbi:hypothetical protein [Streptomyces tendae]